MGGIGGGCVERSEYKKRLLVQRRRGGGGDGGREGEGRGRGGEEGGWAYRFTEALYAAHRIIPTIAS